MKLNEKDLVELANIYNTAGKSEMSRMLQERYHIKNIYNVLRRLRDRKLINEDANSENEIPTADAIFMSMDELCSPIVTKHEKTPEIPLDSKTISMERMIQELIGDRLLELSKYITMNTADKMVIVDKTMLAADGFQLILH